MGLHKTNTLAGLGFPDLAPDLVTSLPAAITKEQSLNESGSVGRKFSKMEEDILKLLSDGHTQETVASTLGVSAAAISIQLSKDWFKSELAARKSIKLEKYTKMDEGYDRLEQTVLTKLEHSLPFVTKPSELVGILSKLNNAKRRLGDSGKLTQAPVTQIINITLPTSVVHKFSRTKDGHVVAVDDKSLVTITSNSMDKLSQTVLAVEDAKEIANARPPTQYPVKGSGPGF